MVCSLSHIGSVWTWVLPAPRCNCHQTKELQGEDLHNLFPRTAHQLAFHGLKFYCLKNTTKTNQNTWPKKRGKKGIYTRVASSFHFRIRQLSLHVHMPVQLRLFLRGCFRRQPATTEKLWGVSSPEQPAWKGSPDPRQNIPNTLTIHLVW